MLLTYGGRERGSGCFSPIGGGSGYPHGLGWGVWVLLIYGGKEWDGGGGGGWLRGSGTHPALRWGCKTQVWNWGGGGSESLGGLSVWRDRDPPPPLPKLIPMHPTDPTVWGCSRSAPAPQNRHCCHMGRLQTPLPPPQLCLDPPCLSTAGKYCPGSQLPPPPSPTFSPPPISLPTPTTSSEGRLGLCTPLAPLGGGPFPLPPPPILGSLPSFPAQRRSVPPPPNAILYSSAGGGGGRSTGLSSLPLQPPAHPPLVGQ